MMYSDHLVSWCMWGMANILKALKFLNEDAKQVHGYIHPTSVFVTQSGSWKLGFFDLTYEFKPKEDPPYFYLFEFDFLLIPAKSSSCSQLPTALRSARTTTSPSSGTARFGVKTCTASASIFVFKWAIDPRLIDFVFKGLKIPSQLSNYVLRCKSAPLGRPAPSRLLAAFSKHPLVK